MATLVLTVVGGIVGGPMGAAVGAAVGSQFDAMIFKPKGRSGPRLSDLRLQASTYGTAIPRLYGTMRVAGTVIWASDLIETRAKSGGGKGRPSITEYSYAASFAVAVSARRIGTIRRIWADGNVLRGANGLFQERCQFRVHDGDEDQAPDPLIASALGPDAASAFRGLAYVVFEDLALARYGNRIPSLTFEVEADGAPVSAGIVGADLLNGAIGIDDGLAIDGYAALGSVGDALSPLIEAGAMRLVQRGAAWRLETAAGQDALTLSAYQAAGWASGDAAVVQRRRVPQSALPQTIRLRHHDAARDYQLGQQSVALAAGGRSEMLVDLPAVLSADAALRLVQELALAAGDGRERVVVQGDLATMAAPVGAVFDMGGGALWRLSKRTAEGDGVQLELVRHQPLVPMTPAADGGSAIVEPDPVEGAARVAVFASVGIGGDGMARREIILAGGSEHDGWRGADLWWRQSAESEAQPVGSVRAATTLGTLAAPLVPTTSLLCDRAGAIEVQLMNGDATLESRDEAALLAGANRALVGQEIIQFARADQLGGGRWRLTDVLRARDGTAMPEGGHATGSDFVLLNDPALLRIDGGEAAAMATGGAVEWMPRGRFDQHVVAVSQPMSWGAPPSPVHGHVDHGGDGSICLRWTRRSRSGQLWRDYQDVPLGEAQESYRVALVVDGAEQASWTCATPELLLPSSPAATALPGAEWHIVQIGDHGPSAALRLGAA